METARQLTFYLLEERRLKDEFKTSYGNEPSGDGASMEMIARAIGWLHYPNEGPQYDCVLAVYRLGLILACGGVGHLK